MDDTAKLSSFDRYTTFTFRGKTITFRTCNGLERYTRILHWDNVYIEVMAKYLQNEDDIEEYIDLEPIIKNLYMDADKFLNPIKNVVIEYE